MPTGACLLEARSRRDLSLAYGELGPTQGRFNRPNPRLQGSLKRLRRVAGGRHTGKNLVTKRGKTKNERRRYAPNAAGSEIMI